MKGGGGGFGAQGSDVRALGHQEKPHREVEPSAKERQGDGGGGQSVARAGGGKIQREATWHSRFISCCRALSSPGMNRLRQRTSSLQSGDLREGMNGLPGGPGSLEGSLNLLNLPR